MKYVTVVRITAARPGPIDSRAPRASHRPRVLRPRRSTARVALTLADASRVPLPPRGPFGAGNGAPGGSFRPAPRHTVLKTAQSRGNLWTHPRCRPERSSRSATIGTIQYCAPARPPRTGRRRRGATLAGSRPRSGPHAQLHALVLQAHDLLEDLPVALVLRRHAPLPAAQLGQAPIDAHAGQGGDDVARIALGGVGVEPLPGAPPAGHGQLDDGQGGPAAPGGPAAVAFKADVGSLWRSPSGAVAQLTGVWTRPDLRGRGIGTVALAAVVDAVRADHVGPDGVVSLYANDFNAPARALYDSLGFTPHGAFATVLL